jgi:hypothetical protein
MKKLLKSKQGKRIALTLLEILLILFLGYLHRQPKPDSKAAPTQSSWHIAGELQVDKR